MRNVAGLSTAEAQKSSDLFMKCRYMDDLTDGKGVIFATGTPIYTPYQYSNTKPDVHSVLVGNVDNLNHGNGKRVFFVYGQRIPAAHRIG